MRTSSSLLLALACGGSLAGYSWWACIQTPRSVEGLERVEMEVEASGVPLTKNPSERLPSGLASPLPSTSGRDANQADELPMQTQTPAPAHRVGARKETSSGGPSFEFVRASLAAKIESDLPTLVLSESELDVIADATLRLRSAQQSLRTTSADAPYAGERAALRRQVEEAIADFHDVLGMDPAGFSRHVGGGTGIDPATSADAKTPILIRPIGPREARK